MKITFNCKTCSKEKIIYSCQGKGIYCSYKCSAMGRTGVPRSMEVKRRIGIKSIGRKHSEETKKKMSEIALINQNAKKYLLGLKRSNEVKKRMSEIRKANPNRYWLGKKRNDISGKNNYNWQGGKTSLNSKIRNSLEYKQWRNTVFIRDNYTCTQCGICNGNGKSIKLQADHIKPFALFPLLRFEISNGRTLCIDCHKKTDTFAGRTRHAESRKLIIKHITYN